MNEDVLPIENVDFPLPLLMEEILHHPLSMKPYDENGYILHINWCRISSINSMVVYGEYLWKNGT